MTYAELRDQLSTHFSIGELRNLCFDLDISYDNLAGETLEDKARELLAYCHRRGLVAALVERCQELRPLVAWPGKLLGAGQSGITRLMMEVGFEATRPTKYDEYYPNEEFLKSSSHHETPIFHVELFRNREGLGRNSFNFKHEGDFHIAHPIFAELEKKISTKLEYNETRLRVAEISLKNVARSNRSSLWIKCEKARFSQVLVTNHSDELTYDGKLLRDEFAPAINGRLPPLKDSIATNPAGCNCLLETTDNYFVVQRRSERVETSRLLYAPSVSGGTEYSRPYLRGYLDPFKQLSIELGEEIGLRRDCLVCDPLLLAISRDVQRNGLPEFFFYAKLGLGFSEVERAIEEKPRDSWEHRGIFPLRVKEADILGYIMSRECSVALRANLTYYLELIDVVRKWSRGIQV